MQKLRSFALRISRRVLGGKIYGVIMRLVKSQGDVNEVDLVFLSLRKQNRQSPLMIDVGAHLGESFDQFSSSGWKVHCFEPNPNNHSSILQRIGSNDVTLYNLAVSNSIERNIPIYVSEVSSGITSIHAFHETHKCGFTVDTITLESHFIAHNIKHVDFLKIDTEGHDLFVLKGIDWEEVKPDVIVCELEDLKTMDLGYSFSDLGQFLVDRGYTVWVSEWYPIVEYGKKHKWRCFKQFPCELEEFGGWGNLIACRHSTDASKIEEQLRRVAGIRAPSLKS